jgi:Spy/CpxP family protein refolding chaperone
MHDRSTKHFAEVKMKRWNAAVAALVVLLVFAVSSYAQGLGFGGRGDGFGCGRGPGFGHGAHGGFGFRMAQELNLSKEQMDKMWNVQHKYAGEMRELRYDLFQKRIEAKNLYTDPKADEATILAKQKEMSSLKQQLQDKVAQMRLEQRRILTPEQLKKLGELRPGHPHHGKGRYIG